MDTLELDNSSISESTTPALAYSSVTAFRNKNNSVSSDLDYIPSDYGPLKPIGPSVIGPLSEDPSASFLFQGFLGISGLQIPVDALADTGCTGTIIHPRLVHDLPKKQFHCVLTFGNDSKATTTWTVTTELTLGNGYTRTFEFVVAETGYDIILGTPWFESLDEITIHWRKRLFRFSSLGQQYQLRSSRIGQSEKILVEASDVADASQIISESTQSCDERASQQHFGTAQSIIGNDHSLDSKESSETCASGTRPAADGRAHQKSESSWKTLKCNRILLMPKSQVNRTLRQSKMAAIIFLKPELLASLDNPECFAAEVKESLTPSEVQTILDEYKSVFGKPSGLPPDRPENHRIRLKDPNAIQPKTKIYHLSAEELEALRERLQELLEKGFIQPSTSPFGAPILFAKKKDGSLRLCVDYRALNKLTIKDVTPLPNIAELRDRLRKAKFLTKIDLLDGYYNIRIAEEDVPKTAFRTRYGHFEFTVLPFGLTNAPATFMQMINRIFGDLYDKFVVAYLDDILIYSETWEEHLQHLREVLERLQRNHLFAKASKCDFAKSEVEFCGHLVNPEGIRIHPRNIEALHKWPRPKDIHDLRSFLGLINYFKEFIPNMADTAFPLTELLKQTTTWEWTELEHSAMLLLIHRVTTAGVLAYFDPDLPIHVYTDASGYAVSGWLGNEKDGKVRPVLYWSRKMKPCETRYTVLEQELLALVDFIKHARPYLAGHQFMAHTDHKALIHLETQPHLSRRQARWVELLQEYNFRIQYIPGEWNTVADLLSRRPDYAPLCNKCRRPIEISATLVLDLTTNRLKIIKDGMVNDDFALDTIYSLQHPEDIRMARGSDITTSISQSKTIFCIMTTQDYIFRIFQYYALSYFRNITIQCIRLIRVGREHTGYSLVSTIGLKWKRM